MIFSFAIGNDEEDESKNDDERDLSSVLSKTNNNPECLSKNLLYSLISRSRRASISRPYFHHWRGSRDNSRYSSKNLLPFSPRLGKRAIDDDNESEGRLIKHQAEEEINSPDLDAFLTVLTGHLQKKKIDVTYEDPSKICLSEPVNELSMKEIWDKFESHRRQQEAQERHSKGKHPLLFRYRLG